MPTHPFWVMGLKQVIQFSILHLYGEGGTISITLVTNSPFKGTVFLQWLSSLWQLHTNIAMPASKRTRQYLEKFIMVDTCFIIDILIVVNIWRNKFGPVSKSIQYAFWVITFWRKNWELQDTASDNSFAENFGDGFFATVYMQFRINIFEVCACSIKRNI